MAGYNACYVPFNSKDDQYEESIDEEINRRNLTIRKRLKIETFSRIKKRINQNV